MCVSTAIFRVDSSGPVIERCGREIRVLNWKPKLVRCSYSRKICTNTINVVYLV